MFSNGGKRFPVYVNRQLPRQLRTCDPLPFEMVPLFLHLKYPIILQKGCAAHLLKPALGWNFYWEKEGIQREIFKVSSWLMSRIWLEGKQKAAGLIKFVSYLLFLVF